MSLHVFGNFQFPDAVHAVLKGGEGCARQGRWILLALMAVGLALLASASLVERPAGLREAAELPPAPSATHWAAESAALPEMPNAAPRAQTRWDAYATLPIPGDFTAGGCVRECDTNGCPLRGMALSRPGIRLFPGRICPDRAVPCAICPTPM